MRKQISIVIVSLLFSSHLALSWGGKGHDIIANIADTHLNPKAKSAVQKILDGRSMVYYSIWLDNTRGDDAYKHTLTWHYANVDEDKTYETMEKNSKGDVYTATLMAIEKLNDNQSSDSIRSFYLKCLIHLVADLHCPMHLGRATDKGGNGFTIKWFGRKTNLHRLWDTQIIESLKTWSYTEWRENIDIMSSEQYEEIVKGDVLIWLLETQEIAKEIYDYAQKDKNYSYDYMKRYAQTVEQQLLRGGYRLAYILNNINW